MNWYRTIKIAFPNLSVTNPEELRSSFEYTLSLMADLENRLKSNGLSPEDVHGGNLGLKNDMLYILDLGAFSV